MPFAEDCRRMVADKARYKHLHVGTHVARRYVGANFAYTCGIYEYAVAFAPFDHFGIAGNDAHVSFGGGILHILRQTIQILLIINPFLISIGFSQHIAREFDIE